MISQSRRKRRTTPRSLLWKSSREQGARSGERESHLRLSSRSHTDTAICNLPSLASLSFVVFLSGVMSISVSASELSWRTGRSPAAKSVKPTTQQRFSPPSVASYRSGSTVRLAQFEEPGPDFTSGSELQAQMRSIVVDREEAIESARSAQVPTMPETNNAAAAAADGAQLDSQPRNPFGETPADSQLFQPPQIETPADEFQPAVPPLDGGLAEPPGDLPSASEDVIDEERQKAAAACSQSRTNLRSKTIDQVILSIAVTGNEGIDFPFECSIDQGDWHPGRAWEQTTYLWKASALCHKPLYFEDEQLERYGHSWPPCCQPLVSGAHFFTRLPVLPYCMGVSPPLECEYTLGHYRPGSCAPYMINPIPISARGALIQAGAVAGTAAVLP